MLCKTWSCRALAAIVVAGLSVDPSFAQVTTTYSYDAQGQVKTVTRPAQTVTYTYDAAANRTQMTATTPLAGRASAQTTSVATNSISTDGSAPKSASTMPPPPSLPSPSPLSPLASAEQSQ